MLAKPAPSLSLTTAIHSIDDERARVRWEALWARSPQRSPFSALPYVRAVAEVTRAQVEMHLVESDGGDAAGALVLWRRRGPYRLAVVPPFTPYAAIVTREPADEAAVHARRSPLEALAQSLEHRFHVLRFALHPAFADVRPFLWRGWTARPFYTYHLPLSGAETLAARWSANARRTYQKEAGRFRLDEAAGPATASAVARLCAASYDRQGRRPPIDAARLGDLVARAREAGLARLFTVTPTGADQPTGGLAVLHDGREAAYWVAGSEPGAAMTVLLGQALPHLCRDGVSHLDFVGANTPSIAEFKRRFGPVLLPYYRVETCTRPELALLLRMQG